MFFVLRLHLLQVYVSCGEELQRLSGETVDGPLNWELVLEALWRVVVSLMTDRDWAYAFTAVGPADRQQSLSKRTRNKLQYTEDNPEVLHSLPLLDEFVHIFLDELTHHATNCFYPSNDSYAVRVYHLSM